MIAENEQLKHVIIYTDGACSGNPGPGGYGAVLKYGQKRRELSGGFRMTTNNRMELMAVIVGLDALRYKYNVTVSSSVLALSTALKETEHKGT